jgi:uncharacterized protein
MTDPILNDNGMTELHLAAYHGELDWVKNCLQGGLSVHARDRGGYTPLHWAADMGVVDGDREEIVAVLIRAGADINAIDDSGQSVLTVARRSGNEDIVRQLVEMGAMR